LLAAMAKGAGEFMRGAGLPVPLFRCIGGPGPEVFHVMEGEAAKPVAASFSAWFDGAITDGIDGG
jgi:hypothetical protein